MPGFGIRVTKEIINTAVESTIISLKASRTVYGRFSYTGRIFSLVSGIYTFKFGILEFFYVKQGKPSLSFIPVDLFFKIFDMAGIIFQI